jgi:hypothetical protein
LIQQQQTERRPMRAIRTNHRSLCFSFKISRKPH